MSRDQFPAVTVFALAVLLGSLPVGAWALGRVFPRWRARRATR